MESHTIEPGTFSAQDALDTAKRILSILDNLPTGEFTKRQILSIVGSTLGMDVAPRKLGQTPTLQER